MSRQLVPFLAVILWLTAAPVRAQTVDDFLCSSFSYKCKQGPALPPPSLAPDVPPIAAPKASHAAHKHASKHKAVPKSEPAAEPASEPSKPAATPQ